MKLDHSNVDWYMLQAQNVRESARNAFGVELDTQEINRIVHELYRVVNSAKVRANAVAMRG